MVNRKDFRPSNNSSSISAKNRKLINNVSQTNYKYSPKNSTEWIIVDFNTGKEYGSPRSFDDTLRDKQDMEKTSIKYDNLHVVNKATRENEQTRIPLYVYVSKTRPIETIGIADKDSIVNHKGFDYYDGYDTITTTKRLPKEYVKNYDLEEYDY